MARVLKPCAVLKEANPRSGKEPHFGSELTSLFATIFELPSEFAVEKHNGFADAQAIFCAAEAQNIDPDFPGKFLRRDAQRDDGVSEASAVHLNLEIKSA